MQLWQWPTPLHEGRLVRRYERFIAEVQLGRTLVRAHCVNPGRMEGMVIPGARVWLSEAPGRHLPWTWELMEFEGRLIGANTSLPNKLVGEVLRRGLLPGLDDATARRIGALQLAFLGLRSQSIEFPGCVRSERVEEPIMKPTGAS